MSETQVAETVAANLQRVLDRVARAAGAAGRTPDDVTLLAVSKAQPDEKLAAAIAAGHRSFGENYVQEFLGKRDGFGVSDLRWHFIGRLQTNKVRQIVGQVHMIHSVDRVKLAREVSKRAGAAGLVADVLVQVNVGEEVSKGGISPDNAEAELARVLQLEHLRVHGLMCIPPFLDAEEVRPYFVQLRELRDALQGSLGVALPELSMGMSGDYEVAIEEGATIVRVGSAIFGERVYRR